MKRFLSFLFILIIIFSLVFPLFGCRRTSLSTKIEPCQNDLSTITLIYKDSNVRLTNIIDLDYDKKTDNIKYLRKLSTGEIIKGNVQYTKVNIIIANGYLYYNNDNWYYKDKDTGVSCLVTQDKYYNTFGGM